MLTLAKLFEKVVEGDQKKVEMLTAHVENEIEVRAANIVRQVQTE